MKIFRVIIPAILIVGLSAAFSFGQKSKTKKKKPAKPVAVKKEMPPDNPGDTQKDSFRILAEGSYGSIEKPFIYIARDKETYAKLQKMIEGLPVEIDFSANAVVAAFLGMKPTGGYGVTISPRTLGDRSSGRRVHIAPVVPPQGAIVTDALTSPFRVVLVPVEEEKMLGAELDEEWKNAAEIYRVTTGKFEFSGGFALVERKFDIDGTIGVWRNDGLVTFAFDLSGKGGEKSRKMTEIASGVSSGENSLTFNLIVPDGLVDNPARALSGKGKFTGTKLSLEFAPLPAGWSDGFAGHGKLEAVKQK